MSKLYNYFENLSKENRFVQSFLIGNTTYKETENELKKIIENFIFKYKIEEINQNPDIYILDNIDSNISKDDIKNLIKNISTTSQFNSNKIYIIDECEKLNDFAYNAILKTLEEPQEGVYAFLISRNIDSVKPTIASRCQKIFISSNSNQLYENKYDDIANEIIDNIEKYGIQTIYKKNDIYKKIDSRNDLLDIIKLIQKKYFDKLNELINNKNLSNDKNEIINLSKKILVTNNNINRLQYYLNKNISIDRFIIDIWRCNNENSSN